MPKYLFQSRYSAEGAKGLAKEGGSARRAVTAKAIESLGGKLEKLHFAFGGVDVYMTVDLPDNVSAAAAAMTASETGAVTTKTVVLLTPEEMDKAARKTVAYRALGR